MPFTFQEEVSNGVQTVYPIDFDFRDKNTVYVYKGTHQDYQQQLSYRWLGDSIELTNLSELMVGSKFYIRRVVDKQILTHVFENTGIRGKFIDDVNYQLMYIAQEFEDGFYPEGFYLRQDLDLGGNKITNVGDATEPGDMLSLGLADTRYINSSEDTMEGQLGVPTATSRGSAVPLGQVQDNFLSLDGGVIREGGSITLPLTNVPQQAANLGLVRLEIDKLERRLIAPTPDLDYGTITETITEFRDYGSIM